MSLLLPLSILHSYVLSGFMDSAFNLFLFWSAFTFGFGRFIGRFPFLLILWPARRVRGMKLVRSRSSFGWFYFSSARALDMVSQIVAVSSVTIFTRHAVAIYGRDACSVMPVC